MKKLKFVVLATLFFVNAYAQEKTIIFSNDIDGAVTMTHPDIIRFWFEHYVETNNDPTDDIKPGVEYEIFKPNGEPGELIKLFHQDPNRFDWSFSPNQVKHVVIPKDKDGSYVIPLYHKSMLYDTVYIPL